MSVWGRGVCTYASCKRLGACAPMCIPVQCRLETDIRFSPPAPATLLPEARTVSPHTQGSSTQSVLLVSLPWRFRLCLPQTWDLHVHPAFMGIWTPLLGLRWWLLCPRLPGPSSLHVFKNSVSEWSRPGVFFAKSYTQILIVHHAF